MLEQTGHLRLPRQLPATGRKGAPRTISTAGLPVQQRRWRRVWATPTMMHYNRLIALVLFANAALLLHGVWQGGWWTESGIPLSVISNLILANFGLAILIRQQLVINLLYKIATSVPTHWPLSIRRVMGKVYHFSRLHVGGALAGAGWLALFTVSLTYAVLTGRPGVSLATAGVTYALLAVVVLMVSLARPSARARFHDRFERSHRLGGWAALLLFWAQTLLFVNDQRGLASFSQALRGSPAFWVLILLTISIALPWLRLRRVPVRLERPSTHVALARFNYGVSPFAGSSTAVSRNPLLEWHSFANVPAPGQEGFRMTISRAGDWTGQLIDELPSHLWVKGIATAGVGNIDKLFKRVVWIATGSGIGPTLPHLLYKQTLARLVWSTRSPRQTYGEALVEEILAAEPEALIWDTSQHGRPNLLELAYEAYEAFDAEAVICISNKKLTWEVVYGLESRGIPAYGAIWDS